MFILYWTTNTEILLNTIVKHLTCLLFINGSFSYGGQYYEQFICEVPASAAAF